MYIVNIVVNSGYSFHLGCFPTFKEAKEKGTEKVWACFAEGDLFSQMEIYKG